MDFYWSWDADFLGNLVTLGSLGFAFAYFAHVVFTRNKAGRRDRLVWGLIGLFNAMVILTAINVGALLGIVPDEDWIKWPARVIATACALNGAASAKQADPLVYLSDLALARDRILAKRAIIATLEHELRERDAELAAYRERYGPLPV